MATLLDLGNKLKQLLTSVAPPTLQQTANNFGLRNPLVSRPELAQQAIAVNDKIRFAQPFNNQEIARPVVNTWIQGINSMNNLGMSQYNPVIAGLRAVSPQLRQAPVSQFTQQDFGNIAKAGLQGVGIATGAAPRAMATGGIFSGGINTLLNAINQKPLNTNLAQSIGEGVDFGLTFSGADKLASTVLKPIFSKIKPDQLGNINARLNTAKLLTGSARLNSLRDTARLIVKQVGSRYVSGFVGGGVVGATQPADTTVERLTHALEQGHQFGLFGAGRSALGIGARAVGGQIIKPALGKINLKRPGVGSVIESVQSPVRESAFNKFRQGVPITAMTPEERAIIMATDSRTLQAVARGIDTSNKGQLAQTTDQAKFDAARKDPWAGQPDVFTEQRPVWRSIQDNPNFETPPPGFQRGSTTIDTLVPKPIANLVSKKSKATKPKGVPEGGVNKYWVKDLTKYDPLSSGHAAWGEAQAGFNMSKSGKIDLTDNRPVKMLPEQRRGIEANYVKEYDFPSHRNLEGDFSGLYSFKNGKAELYLYPDAEKNLTPEMKKGLASLIGVHDITSDTPVISNNSRKTLFKLGDILSPLPEGGVGGVKPKQSPPPGFQRGATTIDTLVPKPVGKIVQQSFKTQKFNLNSKQQKTLVKIQKELGMETRKVRSFEDMKAMAQEIGANPAKLLSEIKSNRITDAEVIALGDVINSSVKRQAKLIKQLASDPENVSFQNSLKQEDLLLNKAIAKRISGGTAGGRAVVAFRAIANKTLDPAFWLTKAKQQLGDKPITPEVSGVIKQLIKNSDRLGLAKFISTLGESSTTEKIVNLWKAGLLTNPATHVSNIISNTVMGGLETVKDLPATAFDIARSTLTGKPRSKSFSLGEVTQQVPGAIRGKGMMKDYLKTGIDPRDINKFEMFRGVNYGETKGGRLAQKYVDTIYRLLGGEDKIFREAAFNRSLYEQANTVGINQKLDKKQVLGLFRNPTPEMVNLASKDAGYATFNKPNTIASIINSAKRAAQDLEIGGVKSPAGQALYGTAEITAPFVRTPANVAEAIFDYLPTGAMKATAYKLINNQAVTNRELADAFGRSATGTSIVALGVALAKAGKLTGNSPVNESERAQWDAQNIRPNSLIVNGKSIPLSRLSPFGNLLTIGAEYAKSGGDIKTTIASALKSVTEQPFLTGASNALSAIKDPERGAEKYVSSAVSGLVPSLIAGVARGTDTVIRSPKGIGESIKSRIPGLRQTIPAKVTSYGQTIPQEGGWFGAVVNPFNPSTLMNQNDPIIQEFNRVGYNLNYIGDSLGGVKLTPGQKQAYQVAAGKYIRELLPQVLNSSAYKTADIDTQHSLVEKAVNKAKDRARKEIKTSGYPESKLEQSSVDIVPSVKAEEFGTETTSTQSSPVTKDYIDASGKIKTVRLDVPPTPQLTNQPELDKKIISSYNSGLTNQANGITAAFQAGEIDQSQAETLLNELKNAKITTPKAKSTKKGSTKKLSTKKAGTIKFKSKFKSTIFKAPKPPTIKPIKAGKLKLSQAKLPTLKAKKLKKITIKLRKPGQLTGIA